MPSYIIRPDKGPASLQLDSILDHIRRIEEALDRIVDEDVLPALARNYERSGLKKHSHGLFDAITKRGAKGNVIRKRPGGVTVGLDEAAIPYAKWAIDGRGPVVPRNAKALHWKDPETGKDIFAKRVKAAPPHDVYYLDPSDLEKIEADLAKFLLEKPV